MILNLIRSFLIILLIFIIIVDFNIPITIDTPTNQLVVAIIVIFLILVVDEIIGFVVGLIFLVIYFKYYQKKINKNPSSAYSTDVAPKQYSREPEIPHHYINTSENCTEIPYISNELLKSAQNNIYNEENLKIEIKQNNFYGIEGINNENLEYLPFDNNFANYSELN